MRRHWWSTPQKQFVVLLGIFFFFLKVEFGYFFKGKEIELFQEEKYLCSVEDRCLCWNASRFAKGMSYQLDKNINMLYSYLVRQTCLKRFGYHSPSKMWEVPPEAFQDVEKREWGWWASLDCYHPMQQGIGKKNKASSPPTPRFKKKTQATSRGSFCTNPGKMVCEQSCCSSLSLPSQNYN